MTTSPHTAPPADLARILRRLGPNFTHGPTLRRLGIGEDTKTPEHKERGIMIRHAFNGHHRHAHGKRWVGVGKYGNGPGVVRTGPPPKRAGGIYTLSRSYDEVEPPRAA